MCTDFTYSLQHISRLPSTVNYDTAVKSRKVQDYNYAIIYLYEDDITVLVFVTCVNVVKSFNYMTGSPFTNLQVITQVRNRRNGNANHISCIQELAI